MPYSISAFAGCVNSCRKPLFALRAIGCMLLLCLFTLAPAAQAAPAISITPESGEVEVAVMMIEISGLEARAMYTVEFIFAGEVVFSSVETSDDDGHISYQAGSTEGDLPGVYTVQVRRDGEVIVNAEFELIARQDDGFPGNVSVSPAQGPIGTVHTVSITELEPQTQYTVAITADETLIVGYRRQHASDDDGAIEIEVFAEAGDSPGQQVIAVRDDEGEIVAQGEFVIDAPPARDVAVAVQPSAAPAGQAFEIQLAGFAPFDHISIQIMSAGGQLIETFAARASDAGEATLTFESPTDLALGAYSIEIRETASDEGLASASLEIVAEARATDELAPSDQPEAPDTDDDPDIASASIEPQSALIGSSHLITVRDLAPNESVSFDVTFEGRSVYRTEKTADEDGVILLELVTTAGDKAGDYTVTVIRQSGAEPSVILTAIREAATGISSPLAADTGEVIHGRLINGGATLGIAAQAGQYLLIEVASADFDPAATFYDPDGFAIAFSDDSRRRQDASIGPLQVSESGDYELDISPSPSMDARRMIEGEFTVTVRTVSVSSIAYDSAIAFALSADAPTLYYELPVETGDSLTISIDSGGELDTMMQLIAPDGFEFAFDDDGGAGFDAEFSHLIFDRRATYILALTSFSGDASGSGTMRITRNPVRALENGATIINLNDKAIRDLVIFDAVADEVLILRLEKRFGDVEDLFVTATVEGMEVMSYSTMGVPDELPLAFVMPMRGRVVVTFEKFGQDDGISLGVSLERP